MLKNLFTAPFRSELLTVLFWREVLSRAIRQGIQTLIPVLGAAALTGGVQGVDYGTVGLVLLGSEAVVVLRAILELRVPASAALPEQLIDRAAAAAAGSLLGVVLANQADVLHMSWGSAGGVAAAAAAASAVHLLADALGVPVSDSSGPDQDTPAQAPAPTMGDDGGPVPVDSIDYPSGGAGY